MACSYFDIGGSNEINQALKVDHCSFMRSSMASVSSFPGSTAGKPSCKEIRHSRRRSRTKRCACNAAKSSGSNCRPPNPLPAASGGERHKKRSFLCTTYRSVASASCRPPRWIMRSWKSWRTAGSTSAKAAVCALRVRYINAMASRTGKSLWHLGCKFITLSPSDETLIQRFREGG